MVTNTEKALDDMSELKTTIIEQNKAFSDNLKTINENLVSDISELRKKINELWTFNVDLKKTAQEQKGATDHLKLRATDCEKEIALLHKEVCDLKIGKCDLSEF